MADSTLSDPARWRTERLTGHPDLGALSPSRAADFTTCQLLYRFRTIDRLPSVPSAAALRGTLVHGVLESLFDLPAADRVLAQAVELLPAAWTDLVAKDPEAAAVVASETTIPEWLRQAQPLLSRYFTMEDPRLLQPAFRELFVQTQLPEGPLLRGFIDRVDISEQAGVRIVDYKTGKAPSPRFEQKAMFQMRFYALMVWRITGEMPALLQLNYLGSGTFLRLQPDADDLNEFEANLRSLWESILSVYETGDWQPQPGPLCPWCSFHEFCPAQGGAPPPLPTSQVSGRFTT